MGAVQRGTAIYLVQRVWTLDPLTAAATRTNATTAVFEVEDPDGNVTPYTFGVDLEVTNPETGAYVCALPTGSGGQLPSGIWTYRFQTTGPVAADEHTFEILASGVLAPSEATAATFGPCQSWIDGDDVAAYDSSLGVGSESFLLDDVAAMGSAIMWQATGRQFNGICWRTVRPCRESCSCWSAPRLSTAWAWSYLDGGWGWSDGCGGRCGCGGESVVRLAGYPVREILEVRIDGVALPEFDANGNRNWRLDRHRRLVRMDDPGPPSLPRVWPSCQNTSLDDTEAGTFSVRYSWGQQPPELGKLAAAAVAAELYRSITPGGGECKLPTSVTRVVRQGVTIERIVPTAAMVSEGSTGIPAIDLFVSTVGTKGKRRSSVWSPDVQGFAKRVGQ